MLLSLRKNGLTSLFKEVRVFKVVATEVSEGGNLGYSGNLPGCPRLMGMFKEFVQRQFVLISKPEYDRVKAPCNGKIVPALPG